MPGLNSPMKEMCALLERIAASLERIEKTLPGCNQEAFETAAVEKVTQSLRAAVSSAHTHELYE